MNTIILASSNEHKIRQFKQMLPEYEILALKDIGYFDEIVEDGETFKENALIKAKAISSFLKNKGIIASVIADDSGLCVEALNGAPGIISARYAGGHADYVLNRRKLLEELGENQNRNAYFICVLVEIFPDGTFITAEGKTFGRILHNEIGDNSFGYECLFFSDDLKKSFGQVTSEEKNSVSHRGRAIEKLKLLRKEIE